MATYRASAAPGPAKRAGVVYTGDWKKALTASDGAKIVRRWFCTYSMGLSGRKKMLHYDMKRLVNIGGISSFFMLGTIFTMDCYIFQVMFRQLLVAALAGCVILIDPTLKETDFYGLVELTVHMAKFVPFLLSMYIGLAMKRWWALRTEALRPVYDNVSNLAMVIASVVPDLEKYRQPREQVLKYGMASVLLVIQAARDKPDLEMVMMKGLLSDKEVEILQEEECYQRAMIMPLWMLKMVLHMLEDSKVPWPIFNYCVQQALAARDGIQTIHTYLHTQIPFAYVHLMTFVVSLTNLCVSITCGLLMAMHIKVLVEVSEPAIRKTASWGLFTAGAFQLLVPTLYQGLLAITYIVFDPFGEDVLDFPIQSFSDYVMSSCRAMIRSRKCPAEQRLFPDKESVKMQERDRQARFDSKWTDVKESSTMGRSTTRGTESSSVSAMSRPRPWQSGVVSQSLGQDSTTVNSMGRPVVTIAPTASLILPGQDEPAEEPAEGPTDPPQTLETLLRGACTELTELMRRLDDKLPALEEYAEIERIKKHAELVRQHVSDRTLAIAQLAKRSDVEVQVMDTNPEGIRTIQEAFNSIPPQPVFDTLT